MRFLRAGLVTPLPGGSGIDPGGITTAARGASLKREKTRELPALDRGKRGPG